MKDKTSLAKAKSMWEKTKPHATIETLAYYAHKKIPFPKTGEPWCDEGADEIVTRFGGTWEKHNDEYIHFSCKYCNAHGYIPATPKGLDQARSVAARHAGSSCCRNIIESGREVLWPEPNEEVNMEKLNDKNELENESFEEYAEHSLTHDDLPRDIDMSGSLRINFGALDGE